MVALTGLAESRGDDLILPASDGDAEIRFAWASHGMRLRGLRQQRGLSLAGVARELGVSKVTVWAWEKGKCRPQPARIPALATIYGVEPDVLKIAPVTIYETAKVVEECRQLIATAYGTGIASVRIMVEV
jgi:transcriptional regulator with XRE-family HTH domain